MDYEELLAEQVEELSELQRVHYASNRYAVLLIFQAMDAAGKDGTIRHVMSGVNPQGCQVFSFKHPSATELEIPSGGHRGAEILEAVHAGLRGMPERDEHQVRALVCGARRRQGKRPVDCLRIILDTFKALKMRYPETDAKRREELLSIRQELTREAPARIKR